MTTHTLYIEVEMLPDFLDVAPEAEAIVLSATLMDPDMCKVDLMCESPTAIFLIGWRVGHKSCLRDTSNTVDRIFKDANQSLEKLKATIINYNNKQQQ